MCKVGGPRCPQTEGKKNSRRARDRVNSKIAQSGQEAADWKSENIYEYDGTVREAYGDDPTDTTLTITGSSNSDDDSDAYKQMWLNMLRENEEHLDDEGLEMLAEAEEDAQDSARATKKGTSYKKVDAPTNRGLLPKDAVIKTPTPSPVFVYGTLRSGQGNYSNLLRGLTRQETTDVTMPGGEMYSNGGFPYVLATNDPANEVKGDLMYLDNDHYLDTMEGLDALEGTATLWSDRNHYNRSLQFIKTGDNEYTQAWVYTPPSVDHDNLRSRLSRVDSGD